MSDEKFDFSVEHRVDGVSNVYIDYSGGFVVTYTEYGSCSTYEREIELELDDILALAELAKVQKEKYLALKASNES